MSIVLGNARIVGAGRAIPNGWIDFDDRILAVGEGPSPVGAIDLGGSTVAPGFIDLHNHGGLGEQFGQSVEGTRRAIAHHRRAGTTSLVASVTTAAISTMIERVGVLAAFAESGEIAGIHLEGPFLSRGYRGAHPPDNLLSPDRATLDRLLDAGRGHVRIVTIAPELPGAEALITTLTDEGLIVAVGHTAADETQTRAAFDRGARLMTHLFNGMPPLHHRAPGPVGAALADARVTVELINDGFHLHPLIIAAVFAAAGSERTALITDSSGVTGLGDGDYGTVVVVDGQARLPDDSSLAGSVLTMGAAVLNSIAQGIPIEDSIRAATATPARVLGADTRIGSLRVGSDADIVVLDEAGATDRVYRSGALVR